MSSKTLVVKILEKEYQIACPSEEETTLRQAARYLDNQMQKIRQTGRIVGLDRIAVMAGLNIAYELHNQNQDAASASHSEWAEIENRLEQLNLQLDDALVDSPC